MMETTCNRRLRHLLTSTISSAISAILLLASSSSFSWGDFQIWMFSTNLTNFHLRYQNWIFWFQIQVFSPQQHRCDTHRRFRLWGEVSLSRKVFSKEFSAAGSRTSLAFSMLWAARSYSRESSLAATTFAPPTKTFSLTQHSCAYLYHHRCGMELWSESFNEEEKTIMHS